MSTDAFQTMTLDVDEVWHIPAVGTPDGSLPSFAQDLIGSTSRQARHKNLERTDKNIPHVQLQDRQPRPCS